MSVTINIFFSSNVIIFIDENVLSCSASYNRSYHNSVNISKRFIVILKTQCKNIEDWVVVSGWCDKQID